MSRTARLILVIAALGLAAVLGYGVARWMARPAATPAAPMKVSAQPAPVQPPPPVVAAAPPAPAAPKPKAAAVVEQNVDAQVAEDAAAVGMTTLDPDPPSDAPAQAPAQDSEPVY